MNIFKRVSAAALLTSIIAAPAFAEPVTYVIDSTHTFPRFTYDHMGLSTQVNRFKNTKGEVVLDKDAQKAEVNIVIDLTSVETGADVFNGHIQGEDFFDTKNHPEATFKSTNVNFENGEPKTIEGELTIKGITKPVTLTITHFSRMPHPMLKKEAVGADAWTTVKRSDFNMDKYAPAISDEVRIDVSFEAIAQ